jgi:hypothetical protein
VVIYLRRISSRLIGLACDSPDPIKTFARKRTKHATAAPIMSGKTLSIGYARFMLEINDGTI